MHGHDDPERSGGGLRSDTVQQQRLPHRNGFGDGSGGSDDGDVQRHGGGFDCEQSERDCDSDFGEQFADGDHQSAGASSGFDRSLQSRESGPERGEHLHGDAHADGSDRRIECDAGE